MSEFPKTATGTVSHHQDISISTPKYFGYSGGSQRRLLHYSGTAAARSNPSNTDPFHVPYFISNFSLLLFLLVRAPSPLFFLSLYL